MIIHLHNWRCFSSTKFEFPIQSMLITDLNGSGKTSLISAIYTLLTGMSWPGTKLNHHLKSGENYFGISTNNNDWSFTGKVNPSGRISTKLCQPNKFYECFDFEANYVEKSSFKQDEFPVVFTYIPTDNYILSLSRGQKLNFFDDLLCQQHGKNYEFLLNQLQKNVSAKQKIIKRFYETNQKPDQILVNNVNKNILEFSEKIWEFRKNYFTFLQDKLSEFSGWIQSPVSNWLIEWEVTTQNGQRIKIPFVNSDFKIPKTNLDQLNELFEKELLIGKILFGAQRDEIQFTSNHIPAQQVLSRGEMRLFVLYLKYVATLQIKKVIGRQVWFFLDDVFNELDLKREEIVCQKILSCVDLFIATGTQKIAFIKNAFSMHEIEQNIEIDIEKKLAKKSQNKI